MPRSVNLMSPAAASWMCWIFDDLLLETLALFEAGELPEEITQRFTYLLVDEFQDINSLQYKILQMLAAPVNNLFIVGG